jgi:hypothetical protein
MSPTNAIVMELSSGTVVVSSETELELHADKTKMHAMSEARFTLSI